MPENDNGNQPKLNKESFVCPHCKVAAQQIWGNARRSSEHTLESIDQFYRNFRKHIEQYKDAAIEEFLYDLNQQLPRHLISNFPRDASFAMCVNCHELSFWLGEKLIFPRQSTFAGPNKDMSEEIRNLYSEAADIYPYSSRASAALLRLCVEKLCTDDLGENGDLNTCIGNLVKKGLSVHIKQALDYCRVIGNTALHAGKVNLEEDPQIVPLLFDLVNDIAEEMITKPKQLNQKYNALPEGYKKQIEKRDDSQV